MMKKIALLTFLAMAQQGLFAQNPIIQTVFTPDPAPYVHDDTVYLFVDHDEDDAQYFSMKDWMLFKSKDMVNWTYCGTPISTETFKWAKQGDNAWAAQAIERNGKWYWYICAEDTTAHLHGIGVAVADAPEGPYSDALGHPLVPGAWGFIDPSVFIDDDGQAYLFWGNNGLWYAPLNEDMISLKAPYQPVNGLDDEAAFGPKVMKMDYKLNKQVPKTGYEEGPWVTKRNGVYYLAYASGGVPEHLAYSTADNINGPWTYGGKIMGEAENSFTIHGGNIEIGGRNFMFYHNGKLPNGNGFRRSTCIEEFQFNPDGSIPFIPFTNEGVKTPLCSLSPYQRVEAETMADSYGLKVDRKAGKEHHLTSIHNGDWIKLRNVDFGDNGEGTLNIWARGTAPGSVQMRIDRLGGDIATEATIAPNGNDWQEFSAPIKPISGAHDIFLLFRGPDGELFEMDAWEIVPNN